MLIDRCKCRIGVEAPRSMPVFRTELLATTEHVKADAGGEAGGA